MNDTPISSTESSQGDATDDAIDPRVGEILDQYFQQLEAGSAPPAEEFIEAHPEFADDLRSCLDGIHLIKGARETPSIGRCLGDFRILREIGRGGMGVVYEAEQISLQRRVALKVMRYTVADREAMERFQREAETVAQLHHSNIVPIYAIGEADGENYFAMQFIEGESLADLQRKSDEPPPHEDVASWGLQAADALAYAHEHEIIHRDIKPSNLIRDKQGRIWLTDFGLAKRLDDVKLSMTGAILGTPRYMSPEQASSVRRPVDHRTDIYSLGATLYELVTGRPLFDAKTPHGALGQIVTQEPVLPRAIRPQLPRDLETIIMRCLSKHADDRYNNAQELVADLRAFLDGRPIKARRPTWVEALSRWLQKHQKTVSTASITTGAAVFVMLAATAGLHEWRTSKLGHVRFVTNSQTTAPLVAEVLRDDGTHAVPSFTLPTQHPLSIPEGDYELRLTTAGELSDAYRFTVYPQRESHDVTATFTDRKLWSPTQLDGDWEPWKRADGCDFVAYDDDGVTLIDGASAEQQWHTRLSNETLEKHNDRFRRWQWVPQQLNANTMYSSRARVLDTAVDLNDDGVDDLLLAPNYSSAIVALSGADGDLLWVQGYEIDYSLSGTTVGQPHVRDVNADGVFDLVACWVQQSNSQRGTQCFLQAISGRDGSELWRTEIDSKAHNTTVQPYPPFAARWFPEYHAEINPSRSIHRTNSGILSFRQSQFSDSYAVGFGIPYPLQAIPGQPDQLLLVSGKTLHIFNSANGEVVATKTLAQIPIRAPQWIDVKGSRQPALLICSRVASTAPQNQPTSLQLSLVSLDTASPIWSRAIDADWEWLLAETELLEGHRRWPLITDLDSDGTKELVVPGHSHFRSTTWNVTPKGSLQILDAESGKTKWQSSLICNMENQMNHTVVIPDCDGDGTKDLATATLHSGPCEDEPVFPRGPGYVFIDIWSGKTGNKISWMTSPAIPLTSSHSPPAIVQFSRQDGLLLVELRADQDDTASRDHVFLFDIACQRLAHAVEGAQRPMFVDLDGGGPELVAWSPANRQVVNSGGLLKAWRVDTVANVGNLREWKYADQHFLALGDVDHDRVDDAVRIPVNGDDHRINMVSGRTGSYLWTQRIEASGTIHVKSLGHDINRDGSPDFLVTRFQPQKQKSSPVEARSGETGEMLWRFQMDQHASWERERLVGVFDLDADGRDELLIMAQSSYDMPAATRVSTFDLPIWLFCFDTQTGRKLWANTICSTNKHAHLFLDYLHIEIADMNQDGTLDIVSHAIDESSQILCQVLNGRDGSSLWNVDTGVLDQQTTVRDWTSYPHFTATDQGDPMVFSVEFGPKRKTISLRALHGKTGLPAWVWQVTTDGESARRSGSNRNMMTYGTSVPQMVTVHNQQYVGFWYSTGENIEYVLLDPLKGAVFQRIEIDSVPRADRRSEWYNHFSRNLKTFPHDLDEDGADELIFASRSHLVAYSPAESKNLWKLPFTKAAHRIVGVTKINNDTSEVLVTKLSGNRSLEVFAVDQAGRRVWQSTPPAGWDGYAMSYVPEVLRNQESPFPQLLYRHNNQTTECVTASAVVESEGISIYEPVANNNQRRDPRHLRQIGPSWSRNGVSDFLRSFILCAIMVCLPAVYVAHLSKGRWTLKTLLFAPFIVGCVLLAAKWPTTYVPGRFGLVSWNFTNAIGVLPSVVFVAVTASAVKKRNWKSVIYCFGFPIFFSGLCYLVLMYTNGYFQETDPIRYVGSDRWIFFSMGAQATGGLMTIGLFIAWIHGIVQQRKHRFATQNSLSR